MNSKIIIAYMALALFSAPSAIAGEINENCEWNGIKLYGNVQVVTSFSDIKVQVVNSFPDLNVEFVSSFPSECGKWKEVTSFPDFTIQYVDSFPDIQIQKVSSFPGLP